MPANSLNVNIIVRDILSLDAGDGVNSKRTKVERDANRKKTLAVNKIVNHLKRFPRFYTAPPKTIFKGKGRMISIKPNKLACLITVLIYHI